MLNTPLVSIVIVNYNGKKWLKGLFKSIQNQSYKSFEVIVVDNNSSDGSVEILEKIKNISLIKSEVNLGFAGGNNLGARSAKGKFFLFINTDVEFGSSFVDDFVKVFQEIPKVGIAQSKIVRMNDETKIDSCGSYWSDFGFLNYIGNSKSANLEKFKEPFPVFSVKGASMIMSRDVYDKVGLFDEDFWNYYEETDLCNRVWIAGYECWYWPKAVIKHAVGGTSVAMFDRSYIQYHNFKNKLLSIMKNFEIKNLLVYIPVFLLANLIISFIWTVQLKFKHVFYLLKAIYWNLLNITTTMQKRRLIQKKRVARDRDIFTQVKRNPKLIYFYYLFSDKLKNYEE